MRPEGKVKLGYEWGYLYVAINPVEGKLYAYFLPTMRKASFQAFLDELAQEIEQPVSLFVDGAASHRSDLQLPDNIDLQLFPAYCPELNPVERFFEELRRVLANQVYDSLQQVEEVIESKLKQYWQNPEMLIKLTNWHWFYPDSNI